MSVEIGIRGNTLQLIRIVSNEVMQTIAILKRFNKSKQKLFALSCRNIDGTTTIPQTHYDIE